MSEPATPAAPSTLPAPSAAKATPWTPRPLTVLLVDDQAIIGTAFEKLLSVEKDLVFQHCTDPRQAIATAVQLNPTIILLDLMMPEIDGITLLKFLRGNRKTREIPIIVITTTEDPKTRVEAFSLGATDFLLKLPEKTELLSKLKTLHNGYTARAQRDELAAKLSV